MDDEPMITGTMGRGLPHHTGPLYAAPCYDVFREHSDDGDLTPFGLDKYLGRELVESAGLLNDYGVAGEIYQFQSADQQLKSLHSCHRGLQLSLAAARRAEELIEEDITIQEGRKQGAEEQLVRAKVRSRIRQQMHAVDSDHSHRNDKQNPHWDKPEHRVTTGQLEEIYVQNDSTCLCGEVECRWCRDQHDKEHCGDPHFRCTRQGGCNVPSTHVFYATLH